MMNNSVIIKRVVANEAASRASAVRREMDSRRDQIQKLCPKVLELEKEIGSTALEFSQKIMDSPADAAALNALANELIADKRRAQCELLTANGLPADHLSAPRFCTECNDTGYVGGAVCRCMRQAVINVCFSGSGLDPNERFESFRFDLLTDEKQRKAIKKIFDYCVSYADSFPENEQRDLLLMGIPGVGKTYLLNCIGARVLGRGRSVLKLTANRLIQSVMDSLHDPSSERPDYTLPELLIIDDLGAEPLIPNVTVEALLSLICERQDQKKATLFATNFSIEKLEEYYSERIVSRLLSPNTVKVIPIETDNVRLIKR